MALHNHHSSENKILGVFTSLNSLSRQSEVFCLPEVSGDIFGEQRFNALHFFMMLIKQAVNVSSPQGQSLAVCAEHKSRARISIQQCDSLSAAGGASSDPERPGPRTNHSFLYTVICNQALRFPTC